MKLLVLLFLFQVQICFSQKDSTLFRNKIFLEFNLGPGLLKYEEKGYSHNSSFYQPYKELSMNFSTNLYYRNKRLKAGFLWQLMYFQDDILNSVSLNCGLNILSYKWYPNVFFGPSITYGYCINSIGFTLARYRTQIGLDYYYKKLHLGLKYDFLNDGKNSNKVIDASNTFLEIGYAFNLESFRKKK